VPTEAAQVAPVLLDGATATELQRAGIPVREPWWTTLALRTASHRRVLRAAHTAHLRAGAQVITANTFRCHDRTLRRAGATPAVRASLVRTAVGLARQACADAGISATVAGSLAPVADCYRPDLVPPNDELAAEHTGLAADLVRAGVDLILVETMNSVREARVALSSAIGAGAPAWVSFVCRDNARLLSGEPLSAAARTMEALGAQAVLVNCTTPAGTTRCLAELRASCAGPIGAYPNIEDRASIGAGVHVDRYVRPALSPMDFAELTARWQAEFSPDILGGCCGTSPTHLLAMATRLSTLEVAT
jgi:S-methylmethionine-dependent homocysteine/selenocysteine methylase